MCLAAQHVGDPLVDTLVLQFGFYRDRGVQLWKEQERKGL